MEYEANNDANIYMPFVKVTSASIVLAFHYFHEMVTFSVTFLTSNVPVLVVVRSRYQHTDTSIDLNYSLCIKVHIIFKRNNVIYQCNLFSLTLSFDYI